MISFRILEGGICFGIIDTAYNATDHEGIFCCLLVFEFGRNRLSISNADFVSFESNRLQIWECFVEMFVICCGNKASAGGLEYTVIVGDKAADDNEVALFQTIQIRELGTVFTQCAISIEVMHRLQFFRRSNGGEIEKVVTIYREVGFERFGAVEAGQITFDQIAFIRNFTKFQGLSDLNSLEHVDSAFRNFKSLWIRSRVWNN